MKRLFFLTTWITLVGLGACNRLTPFSGSRESDSWNFFRGDPSLSGYTQTRLPAEPLLLWSYKSDSRTVSSPIVYRSVVYWCDKRGRIRGIDQQGEPVFEYDMGTAVDATPLIHDSVLYIGRIDGYMTAVSLVEKDTLWRFETYGQISASPTLSSFEGTEALLFGSYDNLFYSVDSRTGKEIRSFESGYYLNGAAALWENYVIFGGCDAWLRIIDTTTGIQTDSLQLPAYIPASPAIRDHYCYVGDYTGNIYEIELRKGKILRHKRIMEADRDNGSFVSVPALSESTLYILSDDRHLYAIDRREGTIRWKYMLKGNTGESSPVVCNDKILVCTKTGIVTILDARKGEELWEYDTGEQIVGSPAVIKDHFYILTAKGTLFCFGEQKNKNS